MADTTPQAAVTKTQLTAPDGSPAKPLVESKFSVVKTVDSGPPVVMSKAARLIAKRAAAEAAEAAAKESQTSTLTPEAVPAKETESTTLAAESAPKPGTESVAVAPPEEPAVEAEKPAEVKAEPAKDLQPQFNTLLAKEKRLREREKEFEDRQAKAEAETKQARELLELVKADKEHGTYKTLDFLGVNVEDWALKTVGREKPKVAIPEVEELRKEVQELKAFREQQKQQAQAQQYQAVRQNTVAEIKQLLDTDADRFAYTRGRDAAEAVFATLEYHYNQTGELMPLADAADLVEQHFKTEAKSYLDLVKSFEKQNPQGRPAPDTKHTPGDQKAKPESPKQLTTAVADRAPERLSRDALRKRAAAILDGKSAT